MHYFKQQIRSLLDLEGQLSFDRRFKYLELIPACKSNLQMQYQATVVQKLFLFSFFSRGNKDQLASAITSSRGEVTEPAVIVEEVAKQHDVFVRTSASRVLVSARASFLIG